MLMLFISVLLFSTDDGELFTPKRLLINNKDDEIVYRRPCSPLYN